MLGRYLYQLTICRVVARISIDVTTPLPERKFDGVFQIVTEFSPMASPAFEVGRYVLLQFADHICTNSAEN
jgi:exosome complex RNA-binding protein Rrp42 (RNase PH superfamily)